MIGEERQERQELVNRLLSCAIVPVLRAGSTTYIADVVDVLVDCGITAVELTLTTPNALKAIGSLRDANRSSLLIGMGSVLTIEMGGSAVDAGAQFLVSPVHVEGMTSDSRTERVPVVPAGLTPSELHRASLDGAPIVKLFPASAVGPRYMRELRVPMPQLSVMPSGGIRLGDIAEWRVAGAVVVSMGGSLLGDSLNGGDLDALAHRTGQALAEWNSAGR